MYYTVEITPKGQEHVDALRQSALTQIRDTGDPQMLEKEQLVETLSSELLAAYEAHRKTMQGRSSQGDRMGVCGHWEDSGVVATIDRIRAIEYSLQNITSTIPISLVTSRAEGNSWDGNETSIFKAASRAVAARDFYNRTVRSNKPFTEEDFCNALTDSCVHFAMFDPFPGKHSLVIGSNDPEDYDTHETLYWGAIQQNREAIVSANVGVRLPDPIFSPVVSGFVAQFTDEEVENDRKFCKTYQGKRIAGVFIPDMTMSPYDFCAPQFIKGVTQDGEVVLYYVVNEPNLAQPKCTYGDQTPVLGVDIVSVKVETPRLTTVRGDRQTVDKNISELSWIVRANYEH